MWLAAVVTMGGNLNVVVAALFMPPDVVGAYFAAQKISQLLQLPILAVNIVAGPAFARLHARGDRQGMRDVGRRLALILALPLTAGAILIAATAPWLLGLFDPLFEIAAAALIVLSMSFLFAGLGGPVQQVMLMADGERDFVRLTAIGELAGLALIPVLVPFFGIMGAAVAALTAKVIFTVMAVLWCRSRLDVDTSILALLPSSRRQR
jgi:O-antigen/teichoic acid export membrane protein